jgi:hypothetical protein
VLLSGRRAEQAWPHGTQWLLGESDADSAWEFSSPLRHAPPLTACGRAGIVDNLGVIGGCSGTRVCAGHMACARLPLALSDACFAA